MYDSARGHTSQTAFPVLQPASAQAAARSLLVQSTGTLIV